MDMWFTIRMVARKEFGTLLVQAMVLHIVAVSVLAQQPGPDGRVPPGTLPPWMVDEEGRPIAHLHKPDMSCCRCTATEADQDPDVFKRPCFVHGLMKSREPARGVIVGLTGRPERDGIHVGPDRIPAVEIEGFQSLVGTVLQRRYSPRAWDALDVYGLAACPVKTISEMRNGVPTFVRQEVDVTAVINELKDGDAVQTEWAVNGIEVLPRTTFYAGKSPIGALIRLRLQGDKRVEYRRRFKHPEVLSGSPEWEQWVFFEKPRFHEFLTRVFRVPFETPDDVVIRGFDTEYEGVGVFHGTILARERGRVWVGGDNPPQHWWQQMRLLVTDSDPQYFCVSIVLGSDDPIPSPQP